MREYFEETSLTVTHEFHFNSNENLEQIVDSLRVCMLIVMSDFKSLFYKLFVDSFPHKYKLEYLLFLLNMCEYEWVQTKLFSTKVSANIMVQYFIYQNIRGGNFHGFHDFLAIHESFPAYYLCLYTKSIQL